MIIFFVLWFRLYFPVFCLNLRKILGINSTKNTALSIATVIHIGNSWYDLLSVTIEIIKGKIILRIISGRKFFWMFLKWIKNIIKTGIIIIAKEWTSSLPYDSTSKNENIALPNIILTFFLFTLICKMCKKPNITGIIPINGISGIIEIFATLSKLKRWFGVWYNKL